VLLIIHNESSREECMKQKEDTMVCRCCKRVLPNKNWKTANGKKCLWCDGDHYRNKKGV